MVNMLETDEKGLKADVIGSEMVVGFFRMLPNMVTPKLPHWFWNI